MVRDFAEPDDAWSCEATTFATARELFPRYICVHLLIFNQFFRARQGFTHRGRGIELCMLAFLSRTSKVEKTSMHLDKMWRIDRWRCLINSEDLLVGAGAEIVNVLSDQGKCALRGNFLPDLWN
jgi:hypothetical protein